MSLVMKRYGVGHFPDNTTDFKLKTGQEIRNAVWLLPILSIILKMMEIFWAIIKLQQNVPRDSINFEPCPSSNLNDFCHDERHMLLWRNKGVGWVRGGLDGGVLPRFPTSGDTGPLVPKSGVIWQGVGSIIIAYEIFI